MMRPALLASLLALAACISLAESGPPPATVPRVDLARYAGVWYEIARFPNSFQDRAGCEATRAIYMPNADGTVGVLNTCRGADGAERRAEGWARATDASNARLRVTFFWPFFGDYWVIGLDPDYRWAVVGSPGRDYLWILSRTPALPAGAYSEALAVIRREGFDTTRLRPTAQPGA